MLEAAGGVFRTHESCRIGTEVGAIANIESVIARR